MAQRVAGDMYESITGQLFELGRQLRQPNGYPFDPTALKRHLQDAIEGRFSRLESGLLTIDYLIRPSLVNLNVVEHPNRSDVVQIDLAKVERVLTLKPGENYVRGEENLKRLKKKGKVLLDVRVLEECLKNPHLIPDSWKEGVTYFWGTIFSDSHGDRRVAYLYWFGGRWYWYYFWLGLGWHSLRPAACLASS
ncbi:MAG: hypothetical protein HYT12_00635 [Candidatus Liptonbacteria bacterium]|nr:hypothetical protein [Candidatus Liptonbacteria bacterium]